MFLKAHKRCKDGKQHVYYTLTESLRVNRKRVAQRTVLHLGELNTTQVERWQRTIETIQEDGQRQQLRLFTDREGQAPVERSEHDIECPAHHHVEDGRDEEERNADPKQPLSSRDILSRAVRIAGNNKGVQDTEIGEGRQERHQ